jgi:hypothetical protein
MSRFVIQKYAETPHLVRRDAKTLQGWFKYDIRQWVLVSRLDARNAPTGSASGGSENGLRAYFYQDCYLRFAGRPYDTHERKDAASPAAAKYDTMRHLTNNALVKYTTGVDVHETMWHSEEFSSYLQKNERFDFEHVQQQMKNIAKHALLSVQGKVADRPHSFEILGFDFLVDRYGKVWLLEVNRSPDLGFSTCVTERLVTAMLRDSVRLVLDVEKLGTSSAYCDDESSAAGAADGSADSASANMGRFVKL